jgi:hypothetical protein
MKTKTILILVTLGILSFVLYSFNFSKSITFNKELKNNESNKVLRHVVLFKFKEGTSHDKIKIVESEFKALKDKIPQILSYEWGLNNSPEGLDKGFTHCFILSFTSEKDREIYLPHPDHQAFVKLLDGILEDVLVVDYWAN